MAFECDVGTFVVNGERELINAVHSRLLLGISERDADLATLRSRVIRIRNVNSDLGDRLRIMRVEVLPRGGVALLPFRVQANVFRSLRFIPARKGPLATMTSSTFGETWTRAATESALTPAITRTERMR